MNINFNARINNTSYGLVGLNLLKSLVEAQNNVCYWPIEDIDRIQADQEHFQLIREAIDKQGMYHHEAPCIRHCHQNDLASYVGKGLKIGSTVFELDKFNKVEHNHLSMPDALVTASKWGREILIENGFKQPIGVVPHGVDRDIFHETISPGLTFDNNPTVFINVSKIEIRKSHMELLEAFNKAFTPKDNVILLMCWYNRFYSKEENNKWNKLYKDSPLGNKIFITPEFLVSQKDIAKLYASADCNLSLGKAEGFGLSGLEAMSMGKQVVITNYSGHTEYANSSNSMLIEINELEPAYDGFWFKGDTGNWAMFGGYQIEQLVSYMRNVHKNKQEGNLKINQAGINTSIEFSWSNAANKLTNFIKEPGVEIVQNI